jgi:adhesin transport system membrane fusion protein
MSRREIDFMDDIAAVTELKPPRAAVGLLIAIAALVVFGIIWSAVARVDEIARGQGRVVPSQKIQVVQSLEGGVLQEILVREGELVKKNQVLLRISDVQFSSEERGTEARFLSLSAKKARLEAEASGKAFVVPEDIKTKAPQIAANELALYQSRQKELENAYDILNDKIEKAKADMAEVNAQINRLTQSRGLLNQELSITREMVRKRAVPKLEEIRLNRELADISGQIKAESQRKTSLDAELSTAENEKKGQADKFRSQALTEMNEVETQISGLQENLKSIGDRVDRAEIRSPVDGIVNSMALNTIGGVVEPAMKLVEIVPVDDELKIVARIQPDQIAFIHPGQAAKVKITAYDAQKYGRLDGELVRIGANSVTDQEGKAFFEIEIRTTKNYLGDESAPLPITPGMVAEVDILTGKRTILEYLLKPIFRAQDRALTER